MWRSNKKELAALVTAAAVLLIWNLMTVSDWLAADEAQEALARDIVRLNERLPEERDSEHMLRITQALEQQQAYNQQLAAEIGAAFKAHCFTIPARYQLPSGGSPRVFFNEKTDEVKVSIVKKAAAFGFTLNTDLKFGDADEKNFKESITMLYLVRRVVEPAIESGLQSLDSLRQQPEQLLTSDYGFMFKVYSAEMTFTGRAENVLGFIDSFQEFESGPTLKQKVFLNSVALETSERYLTVKAVFSLVSFAGRAEQSSPPAGRRGGRSGAAAPDGKKPEIPLGF